MEEKREILLTKPISKLIWHYSLPYFASVSLFYLNTFLDGVFIGKGVGSLGLAGIGIISPVIFFGMTLSWSVGIGANSIISRAMGENDPLKALQSLSTGAWMLLVLSLIFTLIVVLFSKPLTEILGANKEVLPHAQNYFKVYSLGMLFHLFSLYGSGLLGAYGHVKNVLIGNLIGVPVNILLNYLFIFQFDWGTGGAALATVLASVLSLSYIVYFLFSSKIIQTKDFRHMLPKLAIAKEITHLGVSMLIVSLGASLLSIYVNRYLNAHGGATYIALSYIISRLTQLAVIPNSAISLGISPILGFNFGANQYARVLSALKKAHHMLLAFAFIIFLFLMIVPQWALKIFTNDPWLLQEGPWFIRLCFITWLMVPISNIGMIALASMGKAKINLRLSIFNEIILAGALLLILSYFFGLKGIYYKIPAIDILRGALVAIFLWKEIKVLKQDLGIKSNNMVPVTT